MNVYIIPQKDGNRVTGERYVFYGDTLGFEKLGQARQDIEAILDEEMIPASIPSHPTAGSPTEPTWSAFRRTYEPAGAHTRSARIEVQHVKPLDSGRVIVQYDDDDLVNVLTMRKRLTALAHRSSILEVIR